MSQSNSIEIVDYDPHWPQSFNDLRNVIAKAFADLAIALEHVGSSAVPDLPAKPKS